jgi:hypothetical protein
MKFRFTVLLAVGVLICSPFLGAAPKRPLHSLPRVKPATTFPVGTNDVFGISLNFLDGWALNHDGHSWMRLFDISAPVPRLVFEIENRALQTPPYRFGKLSRNHRYRLQGTFYFCEKTRASLCAIQSVDETFELENEVSGKPWLVPLRP